MCVADGSHMSYKLQELSQVMMYFSRYFSIVCSVNKILQESENMCEMNDEGGSDMRGGYEGNTSVVCPSLSSGHGQY